MLSKTAEYALRAAVWLAQSGHRPASAETIARGMKVPRRYLHAVVQDMVAAGLLRSRPGPGGGYALARRADEITILDVVDAVAPLERITECPLGLPAHVELCPLHRELDRVYAAAQEALARVTLAQLIESQDERSRLPLVELPLQETGCDCARDEPLERAKPRRKRP